MDTESTIRYVCDTELAISFTFWGPAIADEAIHPGQHSHDLFKLREASSQPIHVFGQNVETHLGFPFSSATESSSHVQRLLGQLSSGPLSQSGPFHQQESSNCLGRHPLEGKSAGFNIPGTCLQWYLLVNFRISVTLFLTKTDHCSSRRIQARTVVESDHK